MKLAPAAFGTPSGPGWFKPEGDREIWVKPCVRGCGGLAKPDTSGMRCERCGDRTPKPDGCLVRSRVQ